MHDDDDSYSVTGRDGYVLIKALVYAIAFIDSLPEKQREVSDRDDMVALLNHLTPNPVTVEQLAQKVERKTGILPDPTDWKAPHRETAGGAPD